MTYDPTKLIKLCGMLSSSHDGERAVAALKVSQYLKEHKLTWKDVIITVAVSAPKTTASTPPSYKDFDHGLRGTRYEHTWKRYIFETMQKVLQNPEGKILSPGDADFVKRVYTSMKHFSFTHQQAQRMERIFDNLGYR